MDSLRGHSELFYGAYLSAIPLTEKKPEQASLLPFPVGRFLMALLRLRNRLLLPQRKLAPD